MGAKNEIDAIYLTLWQSGNARVVHYPDTVAGINAISDAAAVAGAWSAYVQVVAAAAIANPCWIVGIALGTPQVEAFNGQIAIASGAIAAEVDLADVRVGTNVWPVVEWNFPTIALLQPIQVIASPRLAVRIRKDTGVSLAGFNNCHLVCVTGRGA